MSEIFDKTENHRFGFAIFFTGTDERGEVYEVQRIDDPKQWEIDCEYDFRIPKLMSDDDALFLAKKMGYEFNDEKNPYKVTGQNESK